METNECEATSFTISKSKITLVTAC